MAVSPWIQQLRSMVGGTVRANEPLRHHTTLKIGGPAECMVFPAAESDLVAAVRRCTQQQIPYTVLGFGSNVLAPDDGLPGAVLRSKPALDHIRFDGAKVDVGAGASVARLVAQAAARGLSGVEGLAGVPGSVGGALVMNAGTRVGDIAAVVTSVRVLDQHANIRELGAADLEYAYRSSRLQREPNWLVLAAVLQLWPGNGPKIRSSVESALHYRNRTQPLHLPSAGSIFKNPPGDAAGRLVELAGCKGLRHGGAQVAELHANWIVNLGNASAADVLNLMLEVWRRVLDRTGVSLEPEIRLLGPLQDWWQQATGARTA